jgi:hypothetical protein
MSKSAGIILIFAATIAIGADFSSFAVAPTVSRNQNGHSMWTFPFGLFFAIPLFGFGFRAAFKNCRQPAAKSQTTGSKAG